jgi:hypothetical protein
MPDGFKAIVGGFICLLRALLAVEPLPYVQPEMQGLLFPGCHLPQDSQMDQDSSILPISTTRNCLCSCFSYYQSHGGHAISPLEKGQDRLVTALFYLVFPGRQSQPVKAWTREVLHLLTSCRSTHHDVDLGREPKALAPHVCYSGEPNTNPGSQRLLRRV